MRLSRIVVYFLAVAFSCGISTAQQATEYMVSNAESGVPGGRLVVAQRAEPKTLNPVVLLDQPSREVARRLHADLIHINRNTQKTEPALAKSWTVSPDGKSFTVKLRKGVKFSDGRPLTADDVVFSFQVYQDEKIDSPNRELLLVGGKPLAVT